MSETLLIDMQTDLTARLNSDAYFSDINIVQEDKEDIVSVIDQQLATLTAKAGKLGAAVITLSPTANDNDNNIPFGRLSLDLDFLVLENVTINTDASTGTNKKALSIARRVHRIMKFYSAGGLTGLMKPRANVIAPIRELLPLVAYEVRFSAEEADQQTDLKVNTPQITSDSGTVTITTTTGGAEILYTTDDTHPWDENGTVYSAPFAAVAGTIIKATAKLATYIDSDMPRHVAT